MAALIAVEFIEIVDEEELEEERLDIVRVTRKQLPRPRPRYNVQNLLLDRQDSLMTQVYMYDT